METADALPKKTEELSKGMQQKIQFIATLLHSPQLIVMDEPFAGLDPVNAVLVEQTLLELKAPRQSHSVFHPSHGSGGEALRLHLPHQQRRGRAWPAICARSRRVTKRNHVIVEFEGDSAFLKSD